MYFKYIAFDSAILDPRVHLEEIISRTCERSIYKHVHCGGVCNGKLERTQMSDNRRQVKTNMAQPYGRGYASTRSDGADPMSVSFFLLF